MKTSLHFRSDRGSLLIVAMLMSAIIAISLTSYLSLTRSALTISNRALYNNAAMNLAENGLEEAMYSVNKKIEDETYSWATDGGWTINGTAAQKIWTGYTFDQNATGVLRVYVANYTGAPVATARATVTLGGGSQRTVEKWVQVTLKKTSKFSNGLVAKNNITFSGNNVKVDSWNPDTSDPKDGIWDAPYSAGLKNDKGSVGSISISDAVDTGNGDVWGFVSTAGQDPTENVGPTGSILGEDSAANGYTDWDPSRVATDFSASFDPVTAPTKTYLGVPGTTINGPLELPIAGDTPDADGNYYYTASQIKMTNDTLLITGPVVLKLTHGTAIAMGGSDGIKISSTGTLDIYTDGDIAIAGKGVCNGTDSNGDGDIDDTETAGASINFQVWGTKTSGTQNISVTGNGVFTGTIYAPQASVSITGGGSSGSVCGSVVANNITLAGTSNFHYDESLADDGTGNPFRVQAWKELTSATDRATVSSLLSFN
jgi:hypothetical protein